MAKSNPVQNFRNHSLVRKLSNLPLPSFLNPIDTRRQFLISIIILGLPALGIAVCIELQRGLSAPVSTSELTVIIVLVFLAGIGEEALFGLLAKYFLGNTGIVIGRIIWVILHPFYAPVWTIYRIPMDILFGTLYIKLWRGRLWWLAFIIHPLWNVAVVLGWQLAKMYAYP